MSLTVRERLQALVDGKKIAALSWAKGEYIQLSGDILRDQNDDECSHGLKYLDREWKIYEEPKPEINLGPEHVGRKVRLRNGEICLITSFWEEAPWGKISCGRRFYKTDGIVTGFPHYDSTDIVEILD